MWGLTEQDLGARRRPPNPFQPEPSEALSARDIDAPAPLDRGYETRGGTEHEGLLEGE
jgi:hypothetical protein